MLWELSGQAMDDPDDRPSAAPGGVVSLDVTASDESGEPFIRQVGDLGRRALAALGVSGDVRLRLVADEEMSALHESYAGIAGTTDVLTFDLRDGADGPLDVDIVVCVDEATRQAATRSIPVAHELLLYLVHGVLHCLGHDDHDDEGFAIMHAREDEVMRAIGLGPVFGAPTLEARSEPAP